LENILSSTKDKDINGNPDGNTNKIVGGKCIIA